MVKAELLSKAGKTLVSNDGAVVIYKDNQNRKVNGSQTFKANFTRNPIWAVALILGSCSLYTSWLIACLIKDALDDLYPDLGLPIGSVNDLVQKGGVINMGNPVGWAIQLGKTMATGSPRTAPISDKIPYHHM